MGKMEVLSRKVWENSRNKFLMTCHIRSMLIWGLLPMWKSKTFITECISEEDIKININTHDSKNSHLVHANECTQEQIELLFLQAA